MIIWTCKQLGAVQKLIACPTSTWCNKETKARSNR